MSAVPVDELFVSWLTANLPGVAFASERPGNLEQRLPFVVVRRGGGGDIDQGLDGPIMDLDFYAADRTTVAYVAQAVDRLFRQQTPAAWMGVQFTMLRCNQGATKVGDVNPAVRHMVATYSFSLI